MCFAEVVEEGDLRPSRRRHVTKTRERYYSRSPPTRVVYAPRSPRQSTTYVVQAPQPQPITVQAAPPPPPPETVREEVKITETKKKETPPPPPPEMVEVLETSSVGSSSSSSSITTKAKSKKSGKSRASHSHHSDARSRTSRGTSVSGTTTTGPRSEYDIKEREWIRERSQPRHSVDRYESYRYVDPYRGGYTHEDPRASRDSYHRRERYVEEEQRRAPRY
ncbi:hypothetical protein C1H76_2462 [Elsinoe australis]|uniref:Uncharacterized protein n=1 Tax=Elsinoe australis TaxID=40998 RepID=A0A4U7B323_9PEZI|nr:hypothetical protein C1H76_2462 [Elsinoe australis]